MGSKNLKAIVVQRGKNANVKVYSEALLEEVKDRIQANIKDKTSNLTVFGTAYGIRMINDLGCLGALNLREETFESADKISGEQLREKYYRKNISCHSCPVACGKLCELHGKLIKHPEYETLYALGSMIGVGDLEAIMQANLLCDTFGLDTISTGVTLAFAMECFEKGIVLADQCGNSTLKFGDAGILPKIIQEIAYRKGIGNMLAEGTKRMSEILGGDSWKYACQVKGLELAGHSARVLKTISIGYATNTRGGSHQDARVRYLPDMDTYEGKVELAIATQHLTAIGDSLVQCRFVMEPGLGIVINDEYGRLLKAVTGWAPTTTELLQIAERIVNLERLFNVREGIGRNDDTLPYKVMYEEIPQGPQKGQRTPPEKLQELLNTYYQLRGWDDNGVPRTETLERLGLIKYTAS
jgi:aldehyde:ferredoxin oxidoreductase